MIDFSPDPAFEARLQWVRDFVREKIEPLDLAFDSFADQHDITNSGARAALKPLQDAVRREGLWAMNLPKHLGGPGYGNVELCFLNEILGRTWWGPVVFGCHAPDSGNAEILARFGTAAQKERFLAPLLNNEIFSTFAMTEVEGGGDPTQFQTKAELAGDEWVINGEKWFASNARFAEFMIVICKTDSDAESRHARFSTIIVPRGTPGVEIVSEPGMCGEPADRGKHAHLRFTDVRVPAENLLGPRGGGFRVAQSRLGGGRIHHAMRTIGMCQRALDMMCERALSRVTQGELLSKKQLVQADIAECWIELEQFKLLVLKTAWMLDQGQDEEARAWIAACKVKTADICHKIVFKAMHLLGSLGVSNQTPLAKMWTAVPVMGMADGPTEVHLLYVARALLKRHTGVSGRFPTEYLPPKRAAALKLYPEGRKV